MKLRSRTATVMTFSALLAVVFAAAWGYIAYRSFAMRADIVSISAAAETAAANNAYLISLKDSLRDAKDDLALIDGQFITKDDIPGFIDSLEAKAKATGVKADLGSINLDDTSDADLPRTLGIRITGSGGWKGAVAYLSSLESLPYAIRMDNAMLSKSAESASADKKAPSEGVWNFGADVTVYVANAQK